MRRPLYGQTVWRRFGKGSTIPAMWKAGMSRSSIAGQRVTMSDCLHSRPTWSNGKYRYWWSSAVRLQPWLQRLRPRRFPVVFRMATDPVETGLVASFNRPGGNVTGVTTMGAELGSKQLELLHELAPAASVIALLLNPTNSSISQKQLRDVPAAADKLGLEFHVLYASVENDFDLVFARMKELRVAGLTIGADTFLNARSEQLATLAVRHAIPSISPYREFTRAGGLMSYGASIAGASRQAGVYTGRILKGEKPADLPIEQPTLYEFVINVKSAKALGLSVSPTLLLRADEVIE